MLLLPLLHLVVNIRLSTISQIFLSAYFITYTTQSFAYRYWWINHLFLIYWLLLFSSSIKTELERMFLPMRQLCSRGKKSVWRTCLSVTLSYLSDTNEYQSLNYYCVNSCRTTCSHALSAGVSFLWRGHAMDKRQLIVGSVRGTAANNRRSKSSV